MTPLHLRLIAAAPIVAATLAVAVYTGLEALGFHVLTDRPLNLAEAIVDDDPPAAMRQLYSGVSPLDRYDIGHDVLRVPHGRMTPLEAATVGDRAPILELLLRQGVPVDRATRAHLLCLAGRANARDVATLLARPGVEPACGPEADRVLPLPAAGGR
ncbi:MAG: hypothetical protein AB7I25_01605 [Vicinamibacterales bacterium]